MVGLEGVLSAGLTKIPLDQRPPLTVRPLYTDTLMDRYTHMDTHSLTRFLPCVSVPSVYPSVSASIRVWSYSHAFSFLHLGHFLSCVDLGHNFK